MDPRHHRVPRALAVALACAWLLTPVRGDARQSSAPVAGFDLSRLERLDELVGGEIAEGRLAGAVVLVGRDDRIVWQRTYGQRAVVPAPEPMTVDTVFDLASMTKVVATTTSVMMLVEEGRIRLSDRVADFIPEFGRYGKQRVTVQHLLTHTSGLRPDVDLGDDWLGYDTAIALAADEVLSARPGERFVYSDIGFFLLGEIVARVSGQPFDAFVRDRIFAPLGMTDTRFNPPETMRHRVAPTQACTPYGWPCDGPDMTMLRGVVHDPTARRMGGIAGHAGLFSTAADLARFCRMLLHGGELDGVRVLSPLAVARMTSPATAPLESNVRGLGWDIDSAYSANRGELMPAGSFGHTGFTGTSVWIDPSTGVFVVFLSSRLHPDGDGDVTPLRARVATLVASSLVELPADVTRETTWTRRVPVESAPEAGTPLAGPVRTGIDVLARDGFAALRGLRVGLLTNHTGIARDGRSTIDLLVEAPDVRLTTLFSPEHGIRGILDASVPSTTDERTGLPIHSLYGATRRPAADMLAGLDAVVIDLQDVGARFYTYVTTMAYMMEEAAARQVKVIVLDRPNPIGGVQIEGPPLDESEVGFTGYLASIPIRHGMTIGEMARLFNGEAQIGADLTVIAMEGWQRDAWYDDTGLAWINPSPNMRTLYAATLYPGLGAFEGANLSVGRGTDTPFEHVGAPWIDGVRLAEVLNGRQLPGVRFYPVRFTPESSKYAGEPCGGVFIVVTNRAAVRPVRVGIELASALVTLFPGRFDIASAVRLFGSADGLRRLAVGDDPASIARAWSGAEARWRRLRAQYLLYY